MAIRRYGPVQGAGVTLTEKSPPRSIQSGAYGSTVMCGILEKGNPGEMIYTRNKNDFGKKCGSIIDGSYIPDCALDFYEGSEGYGNLAFVRVTDGDEIPGVTYLYGQVDPSATSWEKDRVQIFDGFRASREQTQIARLVAQNGGRWAGRDRVYSQNITSAMIAATALSTAVAMDVNIWAGAELYLECTGKSYTVLGNTADGVINVDLSSNMLSDLYNAAGTTNAGLLATWVGTTYPQAYLELENLDTKVLSYLVKAGSQGSAYWGLEVYVNGIPRYDYDNLSSDSTNKYYFETVINDDDSNIDFEIEDINTDSGSVTTAIPRNISDRVPWAAHGTYFNGAVNRVYMNNVVETKNYADTVGLQPTVDYYTSSITDATVKGWRPGVLTCTYVSGTNWSCVWQHSVSADEAGQTNEDGINDLNFNVAETVAYTHPSGYLPTITIPNAVGVYLDTHSFTFAIYGPEPGALAGHHFVPNPTTAPNTKVKISDNSCIYFDVGTATSMDIGTTYYGGGLKTPSITFAGTGTITATMSNSYHNSQDYEIVIEASTGGLEAVWLITLYESDGVTPLADVGGVYYDNSGVLTSVDLLTHHPAIGNGAYIIKFTNGDCISVTFDTTAPNTAVINDTWTIITSENPVYAIEYDQESRLGYGGGESVSDQDYLDQAYDLDNSPINQMIARGGYGFIKISSPGVTSTAVEQGGRNYAYAKNCGWRYNLLSTNTTEDSAFTRVYDTLGLNDACVCIYPSWVYVSDPEAEGLKLIPAHGKILGVEAKYANIYKGYHRPAAGVDAILKGVVDIPTGETVINEEFLNPRGFQVIKKMNGNYVIWGDRTVALNSGWKWKHQREAMSHYERDLFESYDWVIFMLNNQATRSDVLVAAQSYFRPEWVKGALVNELNGSPVPFDQACILKIDGENNSALDMESGDLNFDISLKLPGIVERLNISIGKQGIFESVG